MCNFLNKLNINYVTNKRNIISPYELDIFIPELKIAIEHNGLFWHSEKYKDKNYHFKKTQLCEEKGIQLIHIYSDELKDKQDIVFSIIKNKLKKNKNKIYARKCEIREVFVKERKEFFNKSHISGDTRCKKAFGLYYNNELVCCLSFRIPFHKKYKGSIEIARFATKINTSVVGGFSKLFKFSKSWVKKEGFKSILSYADLRFGDGNVYKINGFKFLGKTPLTFWYTDGKVRYNRFKFRAQPGKTEKQVAKENNVFRIYGPGNNRYEYFL